METFGAIIKCEIFENANKKYRNLIFCTSRTDLGSSGFESHLGVDVCGF